MSQIKFLVASNPRSGSTWLESMLGVLPDTKVDYELIWRAEDPSYELVKSIDNEDFRCGDFLSGLAPEKPIVGAKLLTELSGYTDSDYGSLRQTVDPDIRIIHLTRKYEDVFYSVQRGVYKHARSTSGSNTVLERDMHERSAHLTEYDARMKDLDVESRWKRERRLSDLGAVLRIELRRRWARFRDRVAGREYRDFWSDKRDVATDDCRQMVERMLANDRWIETLRENREHFMTVDYDEIPDRFGELVRFVGSSATAEQVAAILAEPPTVRLNKVPIHDFFANADELVAICGEYDARKRSLLESNDAPTG